MQNIEEFDNKLISPAIHFMNKMFSLLKLYTKDHDDEFIHVFKRYIGKEDLISSAIIKDTVEKYFETSDQHYLVEAAILIALIDIRHSSSIFN